MEECTFSDRYCYDCPHRYCKDEDTKYQKLINRTLHQLEQGLKWIDIDFEYNDISALNAFTRYRDWLTEQGYTGNKPSFKTWINYRTNGEPATNCGYHTGTFYFRKWENEI